MKAIVHDRFGPPEVLELTDVALPEVGDDEVLVRVRASSVGAWVDHMMRCDPHFMRIAGGGLRKPKRRIPTADIAGTVEAVGTDVTRFEPGDEVYGESDDAFAEYAAAPAAKLARKPHNLSFEQAAAVPIAAGTALIALRDLGRLRAGQKALIIGAAGGVGSFAVQLATHLGAEVTAVCSTTGVDLVRSLGADHVIDYTSDELGALGIGYDVIFQSGGADSPSALRRLLTRNGTLVLSSGEGGAWLGPIGRIARGLAMSPFVSQSIRTFVAESTQENLEYFTELIEAGALRPVIDSTYPLSDAAAALRHFEEGHTHGKIVLTV